MDTVERILKKMVLDDRIVLSSGAAFWTTKAYDKYGIPALFMCDGPHGLRRQYLVDGADTPGVNISRPAICFPPAVTTAGSWSPELLADIGAVIGEEARSRGIKTIIHG